MGLAEEQIFEMIGFIMLLASFCILGIFGFYPKISWKCKKCGSIQA